MPEQENKQSNSAGNGDTAPVVCGAANGQGDAMDVADGAGQASGKPGKGAVGNAGGGEESTKARDDGEGSGGVEECTAAAFEPVPKPGTLAEEMEMVKRREKEPMRRGDIWYLVEAHWMRQWREYVGFTVVSSMRLVKNPGEIPNHVLVEERNGKVVLKKEMLCDANYTLVDEETWRMLVSWYGGGPALPRPVIETGVFTRRTMVEVYPLTLKLVHNANKRAFKEVEVSRSQKLKELKAKGCKLLGIDPSKVKLINYYLEIEGGVLDDLEKPIDQCRISDRQRILFQEEGVEPVESKSQAKAQNTNGTGASISGRRESGMSSTSSYRYGAGGYQPAYDRYRKETPKGLTGLSNLGNTCFMNSALQCLSNAKGLREYFLQDKYLGELNRENVLGMKGRVAEEFAALVKQLWAGTHSVVAPRNFKLTLGDFAPQFSGYAQHDSQELLSFLLDGLHEDLNRVHDKPYTESIDTDGTKPDSEWARLIWEQHLKRNQSVIVDLFQGQFKSTIVCPDCENVSVTFDPFMYLSLPLRESMSSDRNIFVIWEDKLPPTKFVVTVPNSSTIGDLRLKLAEMAGLDAQHVVIGSVYRSELEKTYSDRDLVSSVKSMALFACVCCSFLLLLPPPLVQSTTSTTAPHMYARLIAAHQRHRWEIRPRNIPLVERIVQPIVHRVLKPRTVSFYSTSAARDGFAYPALLQLSRKTTTKRELIERLWPRICTFFKRDVSDVEYNPAMFSLSFVNPKSGKTLMQVDVDEDEVIQFPQDPSATLVFDWNYKEYLNLIDRDRAVSCNKDASVVKKSSSYGQSAQRISLMDCFQAFTAPEVLGPDDKVYCRCCKEHKQSSKKFDIWRFPEYLVVHLKRFSFTRMFRNKLNTYVEFPIRGLELTEYELSSGDTPVVYDLFAVSNHFGALGGGHYTAFAKNETTGAWYNFDDSSVQKASESSVVSSSAYVLFYKKRATVPISGPAEGVAMDVEREATETTADDGSETSGVTGSEGE